MTNTQKRPNNSRINDKRGNNVDRIKRLAALSMRDGHGPIDAYTINGRRRVRGQWIREEQILRFRRFANCFYCGNEISCHLDEREDESIRAEQDRRFPSLSYTRDNLNLSCRRCNLQKADNILWKFGDGQS